MSKPSNWPLRKGSVRFVLPKAVVSELAVHPLTRDLYPTSVGYYERAEGHSMRRKTHDDWLFLYCAAGCATAEFGGREHPVNRGDLLVLPCGVPHAYWAMPDEPWTVYWVHFSGHLAIDFARNIASCEDAMVMRFGVKPKLVSDFKSLLEPRRPPYRLKAFVLAANCLKQLLTYLALISQDGQPDVDPPFDLEQVHSFMEQNLDRELNLDALAAYMRMSKYQFAKKYHRLTGESPIAHFIHLRIERACRLLDTTPDAIQEIAHALGYEDPCYFSRMFKRVMGYSPKQYRTLNRG